MTVYVDDFWEQNCRFVYVMQVHAREFCVRAEWVNYVDQKLRHNHNGTDVVCDGPLAHALQESFSVQNDSRTVSIQMGGFWREPYACVGSDHFHVETMPHIEDIHMLD